MEVFGFTECFGKYDCCYGNFVLCFMSDSDMLAELYVATYVRVKVLCWQVVVELSVLF